MSDEITYDPKIEALGIARELINELRAKKVPLTNEVLLEVFRAAVKGVQEEL